MSKAYLLLALLANCVTNGMASAESPPVFVRSFPERVFPYALDNPKGIGVDPSGNVYIADSGHRRVLKFSSSGMFLAEFANPAFLLPIDIAFGPDGTAYMSDGSGRLDILDSNFSLIETRSGNYGSIALDPSGTYLYSTSSVYMYKYRVSDGALLASWQCTPVGTGQIGFGVGPSGVIYITVATEFSSVHKYSGTGADLGSISIGTVTNGGLTVDQAEDIIMASDETRLLKFTNTGAILWEAVRPPGGFAVDVALDGRGAVYVLSQSELIVQQFNDAATPAHTATWGALKQRFR